ncbi:MAG: ESPR-type extended signal peptide-containing protein [Collimonas pratensis]|uniref:ESPR-type extended signal peptide-containing protein n=1 Tax=Collimonas pratensis TaxID=279113 RepID=UPI003C7885DC
MNQSFRVIFQAASGTYVAVSELTKSKGKTKSSHALRSAALAGVLALSAGMASAAVDTPANTTAFCATPDVNNPDVCLDDSTANAVIPAAYGVRSFGILALGDQMLGGSSSTSTGENATGYSFNTGIGQGALISGVATSALAVGAAAHASGVWGVAVGADSTATNYGDISVGVLSKATGGNTTGGTDAALAMGTKATATGAGTLAVGTFATASAENAVALGTNTVASGANAIAIGGSAAAGDAAQATRSNAIALGNGAAATGVANDIAIGNGATATGHATIGGTLGGSAMAIGNGATATGYASVALGLGSNATGSESAAFGYGSVASNLRTTAVGAASSATGENSTALGLGANASHTNDVALGQGSTTDRDNSVSIGSATQQRQITYVAAGTADTDAANFGQLKATGASIATALGGGSVVNADGTITTPIYTLLDGSTVTGVGGVVNNFDQRVTDLAGAIGDGTVGLVQQDAATRNISVAATTGGTSVDFTGTDGARSLNGVANGLIAAGSLQAINGGQLFQMQADWDQKLQDLTTGTIGDFQTQLDRLNGQVSNQGDRLDAIEKGIEDGTIGAGTTNPENGNSQIGTGAIASGKDATAIGNGAIATGDNSTATGTNSSATGSNSTATGANSVASGSNSTANGANAKATGENSTALGANSSATGSNSVAIGEGSVADRDNSVSFGSPGNERQLTNVADGTAPTDAVNKRQLDGAIAGVNDRIDRLDTRVDEMGAMSSAQAQMAMSTAGLLGNNRLGVGIGAQNGQSALALGYQRVYGQGTRTLSFGGAASTRGTVSFGAGAGFAW